MPINVISAGISTTVQDLGRPGYYHLGIPMGGAMDRMALRAGNLLVGNDEGLACLECAFFGPELEFTEDTVIAITGAEMPPKIDGIPQPTWTALAIRAGQVLSFDYLQAGARAYIAVAGGIDVPMALGSRSTYAIGSLGGVNGRAVQPGDALPLGQSTASKPGNSLAAELRRLPTDDTLLRILPGLYSHRLTAQSLDGFFADRWRVANEADRMGYRFQGGKPLEFVAQEQPFGAGSDPSNITDACYPYGSVQVPSGAEPIILHRDAVSGGGYFMLGTVISADMDLIGQLQPNTHIRFEKVDMAMALEARAARRTHMETIRAALR
ncbi:biotin-dependent carboxyltransferase family protein [Thioclava kandeliae]|uniref:Biotin-dependent carboxyltransferase family protein n=1 Tax=Thioclava kandeliae TaxID=3070818 RepID=A0ABV1SMD6_9RHOB